MNFTCSMYAYCSFFLILSWVYTLHHITFRLAYHTISLHLFPISPHSKITEYSSTHASFLLPSVAYGLNIYFFWLSFITFTQSLRLLPTSTSPQHQLELRSLHGHGIEIKS